MSEQEQELKVTEETQTATTVSTSQEVESTEQPQEAKNETQTTASVEEAEGANTSHSPVAQEEVVDENESDDDYSELTLPELINHFADVVKDELTEKTRERVSLLQSLFNKKL